MPFFVAGSTQRYQVCHHIGAELTSKSQMMNLEIFQSAAFLAAPAISFQYLISEQPVSLRIQFAPRPFLMNAH